MSFSLQRDWRLSVASREIDSASIITIHAYHPKIAAAATATSVWPLGGVYTFPSRTSASVTISSSSASDTGTARATAKVITEISGTTVTCAAGGLGSVVAGDYMINTTRGTYALVSKYISATQFMACFRAGEHVVGDTISLISGSTTAATVASITGLNGDLVEERVVVALNGTTAVATGKTWSRINNIEIPAPSVGNIAVAIGGSAKWAISSGGQWRKSGVYTVPANKRLVITSIRPCSSSVAAFKIRNVMEFYGDTATNANAVGSDYVVVEPGIDIVVDWVKASGALTNYVAEITIQGYLI